MCVSCFGLVVSRPTCQAIGYRKTPLRKPNRDEGIDSTKSKPKSVYDFLNLMYCFIVLSCVHVVPQPYMKYFILLWHAIAYLC